MGDRAALTARRDRLAARKHAGTGRAGLLIRPRATSAFSAWSAN